MGQALGRSSERAALLTGSRRRSKMAGSGRKEKIPEHRQLDRRELLRAGVTGMMALSGMAALDCQDVCAQTSGGLPLARESAHAALEYLRSVMDQFHDRF